MIAVIVAVLGQAAILLNDFGPGNHPPANDAVTVAAVRKAGAIDIPERTLSLASTGGPAKEPQTLGPQIGRHHRPAP